MALTIDKCQFVTNGGLVSVLRSKQYRKNEQFKQQKIQIILWQQEKLMFR
jgi:hypothetical protein